MRILKTILYLLLAIIAVALLAFSGFFLWQAIPKQDEPPEVLQSDLIFQEEDPIVLPEAQEPAEEPVETEEIPEEAPAAPPETPAEADPVPDEVSPRTLAEAYLQTMTLEQKLWQLFITTPEAITDVPVATRAGDATKAAIEQYPVGGLCYFAANLEDASQTKLMLSNTQSYAATGMFLCIDEEGGTVSRAGSNEAMEVTALEAAADYGARGNAEEVFAAGKQLAQELTALGFNLNLAPVADVAGETESTEIGSRAYSSDPEIAAAMVGSMVDGLQRGGILSCLKHFPGHGSVQTDSHEGTGISERTLEQLRQSDWLPFRSGMEEGVLFVMLSHQINENLSSLPASLSPEVVGYLREELGFAGIILTDSQQMGAVADHYTSAEAAVLAIQAGVDMILMPEDLQEAFDGLKAAVESGTLTEDRINESVLRILTVKYGWGIIPE